MGVVPPADGFLRGLRDAVRPVHGSLLDVRRGDLGLPRRARRRAGGLRRRPDLTCLGKIIGGGLPVGAYGGRADLMRLVAPAGPVYQAGTLSGNPLAMTAGLWCLDRLTPKLYADAGRARGAAGGGPGRRRARRRRAAAGQRVRIAADAVLHLGAGPRLRVGDERGHRRLRALLPGMLARGVYPPPSQFEAWFLSAAHTDRHVQQTLDAARAAMRAVARMR